MSSLALLILLVTVLTIIGIALYLQWIKHYYWTEKQREKDATEQKKLARLIRKSDARTSV